MRRQLRRAVVWIFGWLERAWLGPVCVRCEERHGAHDAELCDYFVRGQEQELQALRETSRAR